MKCRERTWKCNWNRLISQIKLWSCNTTYWRGRVHYLAQSFRCILKTCLIPKQNAGVQGRFVKQKHNSICSSSNNLLTKQNKPVLAGAKLMQKTTQILFVYRHLQSKSTKLVGKKWPWATQFVVRTTANVILQGNERSAPSPSRY